MIPSQDLFELIKSMNKAEKGYFKKYSKLHTAGKQNTYILLFDAISKQKEYNEKKLIARLSRHNFVHHLAVVKNYLHGRILDALENYHNNMSIQAKVRKAINHIEVLQQKGLYDQSLKIIRKAKQDASSHELYCALSEILTFYEQSYYLEKHDFSQTDQIYKNIKQITLLQQGITITRHSSLSMINLYYNYFRSLDKKYLVAAKKIIQNPIFREAAKINSPQVHLNICLTLFFYWYARDGFAKCYKYGIRASRLCSPDNLIGKNDIQSYLVWENNLYTISIEQKNYKQAKDHLQKMNNALPFVKTFSNKAKYYYLYHGSLLHYYIQTGQLYDHRQNLAWAIQNLDEYEKELSNFEKGNLMMLFSIGYYYIGDLKKSIFYANKIRNEILLSRNPELEYFINFFYLIIQYDAGNKEILPYLIQSCYRFLSRKERTTNFEMAIISLLKRILRQDNEKLVIEEFARFKTKIERIPHNTRDSYIFRYFDLISWLESKTGARAFTKVVREKANQLRIK